MVATLEGGVEPNVASSRIEYAINACEADGAQTCSPKAGLMPRGPKGEKRPADVIGNAVHVMRIATGEIDEKPEP